MSEQQFELPREEVVFQRMKDFHLGRISAIISGKVPLNHREGGILVLHLIPESCVFSRKLLDGNVLKEQGMRIRPLGESGGNTRFNVDGFLNASYGDTCAYSQLFRDGRLESVMSDVGYPLNSQMNESPYVVRCGLIEQTIFDVVHDYLRFCKNLQFAPPVWLLSALVDCNGFRVMTDRRFHDLSKKAIDRSPAIFPVMEITDFDIEPQELLHPWCDFLWQASGEERSSNYDQNGDWHQPR